MLLLFEMSDRVDDNATHGLASTGFRGVAKSRLVMF